ncbi:adenosine deaminase [Nocardia sp. CWNU-33]|uniref:adenosine deaminase n=1 Tax=Nocardia sp. CWNU-33 TaxID=3392117 RepID=UPI00398F505E
MPNAIIAGMRRAADAWSDAANRLVEVLRGLEASEARALEAATNGATADAIRSQYKGLKEDTQQMIAYCNSMAKQLYEGATALELEGYMVKGIMYVLLAQLAVDLAFGIAGVPAATAHRATADAGLKTAWGELLFGMRQLMTKFATERPVLAMVLRGATRGAIVGGVSMGGVRAVAEWIQVTHGDREAVDWKAVRLAAEAGAIGGAVGGGVGSIVAPAVTRLGADAASKAAQNTWRVAAVVAAGVTGGAAGGLAAGLYTGGNLADAVLMGIGGGLIGGAGAGFRAVRTAGYNPAAGAGAGGNRAGTELGLNQRGVREPVTGADEGQVARPDGLTPEMMAAGKDAEAAVARDMTPEKIASMEPPQARAANEFMKNRAEPSGGARRFEPIDNAKLQQRADAEARAKLDKLNVGEVKLPPNAAGRPPGPGTPPPALGHGNVRPPQIVSPHPSPPSGGGQHSPGARPATATVFAPAEGGLGRPTGQVIAPEGAVRTSQDTPGPGAVADAPANQRPVAEATPQEPGARVENEGKIAGSPDEAGGVSTADEVASPATEQGTTAESTSTHDNSVSQTGQDAPGTAAGHAHGDSPPAGDGGGEFVPAQEVAPGQRNCVPEASSRINEHIKEQTGKDAFDLSEIGNRTAGSEGVYGDRVARASRGNWLTYRSPQALIEHAQRTDGSIFGGVQFKDAGAHAFAVIKNAQGHIEVHEQVGNMVRKMSGDTVEHWRVDTQGRQVGEKTTTTVKDAVGQWVRDLTPHVKSTHGIGFKADGTPMIPLKPGEAPRGHGPADPMKGYQTDGGAAVLDRPVDAPVRNEHPPILERPVDAQVGNEHTPLDPEAQAAFEDAFARDLAKLFDEGITAPPVTPSPAPEANGPGARANSPDIVPGDAPAPTSHSRAEGNDLAPPPSRPTAAAPDAAPSASPGPVIDASNPGAQAATPRSSSGTPSSIPPRPTADANNLTAQSITPKAADQTPTRTAAEASNFAAHRNPTITGSDHAPPKANFDHSAGQVSLPRAVPEVTPPETPRLISETGGPAAHAATQHQVSDPANPAARAGAPTTAPTRTPLVPPGPVPDTDDPMAQAAPGTVTDHAISPQAHTPGTNGLVPKANTHQVADTNHLGARSVSPTQVSGLGPATTSPRPLGAEALSGSPSLLGATNARPDLDEEEPEEFPVRDIPEVPGPHPGSVPNTYVRPVPNFAEVLPQEYTFPKPDYIPLPGVPDPPEDERPEDITPLIPHLPAQSPANLPPKPAPMISPFNVPDEPDEPNSPVSPWTGTKTPLEVAPPAHSENAVLSPRLPATPETPPWAPRSSRYATPPDPRTPGAPVPPVSTPPGPNPDSRGEIPDISGVPRIEGPPPLQRTAPGKEVKKGGLSPWARPTMGADPKRKRKKQSAPPVAPPDSATPPTPALTPAEAKPAKAKKRGKPVPPETAREPGSAGRSQPPVPSPATLAEFLAAKRNRTANAEPNRHQPLPEAGKGWRPQRMVDELKLAKRAYNLKIARDAAVAMIYRLLDLLPKLHPDATPEEIQDAFYALHDHAAGGMVPRSVSLESLVRTGNLRELMSAGINAMFRSSETDPSIHTTLDQGLAKLLKEPKWKVKAAALGLDVAALSAVKARLPTEPEIDPAHLRAIEYIAEAGPLLDEYRLSIMARKERSNETRLLNLQDYLLFKPLSLNELESVHGELRLLRRDSLDNPDFPLPRKSRGLVDEAALKAMLRAEDSTVVAVQVTYHYDAHHHIRDRKGNALVRNIEVHRDEGVVDPETAMNSDPDRYVVPIAWVNGLGKFDFHPEGKWFVDVIQALNIAAGAGISGTETRLITHGIWLGLLGELLHAWALAALTFTFPEHHTAYEVAKGILLGGYPLVDETDFPKQGVRDITALHRAFDALITAAEQSAQVEPGQLHQQSPSQEPGADQTSATAGDAPADKTAAAQIQHSGGHGGLSNREIEVRDLAAAGKTYGEIAATLGISKTTVKTHLRRISRKLGTTSGDQAETDPVGDSQPPKQPGGGPRADGPPGVESYNRDPELAEVLDLRPTRRRPGGLDYRAPTSGGAEQGSTASGERPAGQVSNARSQERISEAVKRFRQADARVDQVRAALDAARANASEPPSARLMALLAEIDVDLLRSTQVDVAAEHDAAVVDPDTATPEDLAHYQKLRHMVGALEELSAAHSAMLAGQQLNLTGEEVQRLVHYFHGQAYRSQMLRRIAADARQEQLVRMVREQAGLPPERAHGQEDLRLERPQETRQWIVMDDLRLGHQPQGSDHSVVDPNSTPNQLRTEPTSDLSALLADIRESGIEARLVVGGGHRFRPAEPGEVFANIDQAARPDLITDVRDMHAIPAGAFDKVYLERFPLAFVTGSPGAMADVHRVLKAGGELLITTGILSMTTADDRLHTINRLEEVGFEQIEFRIAKNSLFTEEHPDDWYEITAVKPSAPPPVSQDWGAPAEPDGTAQPQAPEPGMPIGGVPGPPSSGNTSADPRAPRPSVPNSTVPAAPFSVEGILDAGRGEPELVHPVAQPMPGMPQGQLGQAFPHNMPPGDGSGYQPANGSGDQTAPTRAELESQREHARTPGPTQTPWKRGRPKKPSQPAAGTKPGTAPAEGPTETPAHEPSSTPAVSQTSRPPEAAPVAGAVVLEPNEKLVGPRGDNRNSTASVGVGETAPNSTGQPKVTPDDSGRPMLSAPEVKVLELTLAGLPIGAIGTRLGYKPETVAALLDRTYDTLGVEGPAQAVIAGLRQGILRIDPEWQQALHGRVEVSARAVQILRLVAEGLTYTEIASRLAVKPSTVKDHQDRTFARLGVHDRTQAVIAAVRRGLLDPDSVALPAPSATATALPGSRENAPATQPTATTGIPDYVVACLVQSVRATWAVGYDNATIPAENANTWKELTESLHGSDFNRIPTSDATSVAEAVFEIIDTVGKPNNDNDTVGKPIVDTVVLVVDYGTHLHNITATTVEGETYVFDTEIPQPSETSTEPKPSTDPENEPRYIPRLRHRDVWVKLAPTQINFAQIEDAFIVEYTRNAEGQLEPIPQTETEGPSPEQRLRKILGGPQEPGEAALPDEPAKRFWQWIRSRTPRNPDIAKQYAGSIVSSVFGNGWMIGAGLLVVELDNNSTAMLGPLAAATQAITLAANLMAGPMAQGDTREVLKWLSTAGAATMLASGAWVLFDWPGAVWALAAAMVLTSANDTIVGTVNSALATYAARTKEEETDVSNYSLIERALASSLGKALGPMIGIISSWAPFLLNFLSYAFNRWILGKIPSVKPKEEERADFFDGAEFLWKDQFTKAHLLIGMPAVAATTIGGVHLVKILTDAGVPEWMKGIILAGVSTGIVITSLATKIWPKLSEATNIKWTYPLSLASLTASMSVMALAPEQRWLWLSAAIAGAVNMLNNQRYNALRNFLVPKPARPGATAALNITGALGGILGGMATTPLMENLSSQSVGLVTASMFGISAYAAARVGFKTYNYKHVPAYDGSINYPTMRNGALDLARIVRAFGDSNSPEPDPTHPKWNADNNWKPTEAEIGNKFRRQAGNANDALARAIEMVRKKINGIDSVAVIASGRDSSHPFYIVNAGRLPGEEEDQIIVFDSLANTPESIDEDPDIETPRVRNLDGDKDGKNKWRRPNYGEEITLFLAPFEFKDGRPTAPSWLLLPRIFNRHPKMMKGQLEDRPAPPDPDRHESAQELMETLTGGSSRDELREQARRTGWDRTVVAALREAITSGGMATDQRLPTPEQLAAYLGMASAISMRKGYQQLSDEGYLANTDNVTIVASPEHWTEPTPPDNAPYTLHDNFHQPAALDLHDKNQPTRLKGGTGFAGLPENVVGFHHPPTSDNQPESASPEPPASDQTPGQQTARTDPAAARAEGSLDRPTGSDDLAIISAAKSDVTPPSSPDEEAIDEPIMGNTRYASAANVPALVAANVPALVAANVPSLFKSDLGWREQRMEEALLAAALYNRPESKQAAVAVLKRMIEVQLALHEATPEQIRNSLDAEENKLWGGMVHRSVPLEELLRTGNMRELMSALLNGVVRNAELKKTSAGTTMFEGLAMLMNQPGWQTSAAAIGLGVDALETVQRAFERAHPGAPITWNDLRAIEYAAHDTEVARRVRDEYVRRSEATRNRSDQVSLRRHFTVQDWALMGMPLSVRELEAVEGPLRVLRIDKLDPNHALPRDPRGRVDENALEALLKAEDPTVSHVLPLYRYRAGGRNERVRDADGFAVVEGVLVYRDTGETVDAEAALALDPNRFAVPLPWRPGVALVDFKPKSAWFQRMAVELGIGLAAGISGTAARFMWVFDALGMPEYLRRAFRGAVIAFMLSYHHTLDEVEEGLQMVGSGLLAEAMSPDQDGYWLALHRAAAELATPISSAGPHNPEALGHHAPQAGRSPWAQRRMPGQKAAQSSGPTGKGQDRGETSNGSTADLGGAPQATSKQKSPWNRRKRTPTEPTPNRAALEQRKKPAAPASPWAAGPEEELGLAGRPPKPAHLGIGHEPSNAARTNGPNTSPSLDARAEGQDSGTSGGNRDDRSTPNVRNEPAPSAEKRHPDGGPGDSGSSDAAPPPRSGPSNPYPKIELHVHLEGTIRPETLLEMAIRNGVELPADNADALSEMYKYRDFGHFLQMWRTTTGVMRTEEDFRQAVIDYAKEAKSHGVVYVEFTFSPINRNKWDGIPYEAMFNGVADGITVAAEQYGVIMRAMPSLIWGEPPEGAEECARWAVLYKDRGIVGLDLSGNELARGDVSQFDPAVAIARAAGLGIVPHAGEAGGIDAIREVLRWNPDGLQHGIAAAGDPALMAELVARNIVLRVTPTSNVGTNVVANVEEHPLPQLLAAGVRCSISTDDPALFGTDLGKEYALAEQLGISPAAAYRAGVDGALCDAAVKQRLREIGEEAFADPGDPELARPVSPPEFMEILAEGSSRDELLEQARRKGWRDTVVSAVREAITSGRLATGRSLPTPEELAEHLGMASAVSLHKGYQQLTGEGYLASSDELGTTVASPEHWTQATPPDNAPYTAHDNDFDHRAALDLPDKKRPGQSLGGPGFAGLHEGAVAFHHPPADDHHQVSADAETRMPVRVELPAPARRALEKAESKVQEEVDDALRPAQALYMKAPELQQKDLTKALMALEYRHKVLVDRILRRLVFDETAARALADTETLPKLNERFKPVGRHIEAGHRYVNEVRTALAVLAARERLATYGGIRVAEGVVRVGDRLIVESPLLGQQRLLDKLAPGYRKHAERAGISIEYRRVLVGEDGQLTVEPVTGVHDEPEPGMRYYVDTMDIAWMNDLTDERSFAEKLAAAEKSGRKDRTPRKDYTTDPTTSEAVWLIEYNNGFRVIEKWARDLDQADAEWLGTRTLRDVGVQVPEILRRGDLMFLIEYVPGVDAKRVDPTYRGDPWERYLHTRQAKRAGVGDTLVGPMDRIEGGNWRLQQEFLMWFFDLGMSQMEELPELGFVNNFYHISKGQIRWHSHDIPKAELAADRERIMASESEYLAPRDRSTWFERVLRRFTEIEKNAREDPRPPSTDPDATLQVLEHLLNSQARALGLPRMYEPRTPQQWREVVADLRQQGTENPRIARGIERLDLLVKLAHTVRMSEVSAEELDEDAWPGLTEAYLQAVNQRLADLAEGARYPNPSGESDAEWQARFDREIQATVAESAPSARGSATSADETDSTTDSSASRQHTGSRELIPAPPGASVVPTNLGDARVEGNGLKPSRGDVRKVAVLNAFSPESGASKGNPDPEGGKASAFGQPRPSTASGSSDEPKGSPATGDQLPHSSSNTIPSREEFLQNFPKVPVAEAFSSPADIARSFGLDERGAQTVEKAYQIALRHIAPFNTWIADSILRQLRDEANKDPNRRFVFIGRDGHILAAGVRGRDPDFFAERCVEIVLSRQVMEMVARDYEATKDTTLLLPSSFRIELEGDPNWEAIRELVPGSWENFKAYLSRLGLDVSALTVIDNSLRGRTQEVIAQLLKGVDIRGHYAFLTIDPDDPNPHRKTGHVFHLPASHWQGGHTGFLPDAENLTFLCNQALYVIESLVPGPAPSAKAITPDGPDQTQPEARLPSRYFPEPIDKRYWEPHVPEASKTAVLLAAEHHARSGSPGDLHSFPQQVRSWMLDGEVCDPDLAALISALTPHSRKYPLGTVAPLVNHPSEPAPSAPESAVTVGETYSATDSSEAPHPNRPRPTLRGANVIPNIEHNDPATDDQMPRSSSNNGVPPVSGKSAPPDQDVAMAGGENNSAASGSVAQPRPGPQELRRAMRAAAARAAGGSTPVRSGPERRPRLLTDGSDAVSDAIPIGQLLDVGAKDANNLILARQLQGMTGQFGPFWMDVETRYITRHENAEIAESLEISLRSEKGEIAIGVYGVIRDEHGAEVGWMRRRFQFDDQGRIIAYHDALDLEEQARGKGFSKALNRPMDDYYRVSGVHAIYFLAAGEDGGLVSALNGSIWNPDPAKLAEAKENIGHRIRLVYKNATPGDRQLLDEIWDKFGGPVADYPTPLEIALLKGKDDRQLGAHVMRGSKWPAKRIL